VDAKSKWSYIAGFFDGEGSIITFSKPRVTAEITNTDYSILHWMQKQTNLGKIYKAHEQEQHAILGGHEPAWRYNIYRQTEVIKFLTTIYPYLKIKKSLAKLAIQFLTMRTTDIPTGRSKRNKTSAHCITDPEREVFQRMRNMNASRSGHARASRNYFQVPRE